MKFTAKEIGIILQSIDAACASCSCEDWVYGKCGCCIEARELSDKIMADLASEVDQ